MPVHSLASWLGQYDLSRLAYTFIGCLTLWTIKLWLGGRKNTWERDWAGKMILVVAEPDSTTFSLVHTLLHLPRPPQILYLPPLPSPLPEDLLTILHTIRLSAQNSPLAQLHCEPLPRTPEAVAAFNHQWGTAMKGTVGEGGRRIDAVVLGSGWEIGPTSSSIALPTNGNAQEKKEKEKGWSVHQFHYHLLTSLLPTLLRAPAERSIRVVSLVSPAWSAGIPSLQGKEVEVKDGPVTQSAKRGITTLLVMRHFQLILDTLASATYSSSKPVPNPDTPGESTRKREEGLKSNIMALSVIMPWTRDSVRGSMGADEGWLSYLLYISVLPILAFATPSSSRAIQSVLFALSAPVRYADGPSGVSDRNADPLRSSVSGGDVVRDCAVVEMPPALTDPAASKANYDALEREVEERIKTRAKPAS